MSEGSASEVRAGGAFVELFTKDAKLMAGLEAGKKAVEKWESGFHSVGKPMAEIGAAISAPLLAAAHAYSESGEEIVKMAERTGMATGKVAEMEYAAKKSHVAIGELENGIKFMQKTLAEAAQGNDAAVESLAKIGLKAEDLKGLAPEEQFKKIADQISKVPDPAMRTALAMEIFSRAGADLLPMLDKGSTGINELIESGKRLGIVLTDEDVKGAHEFHKQVGEMGEVLSVVARNVGAALAPSLQESAKWITENARQMIEWIKQHQEFIAFALKAAMVIGTVGLAFMGLGKVLGVIASVTAAVRTLSVAMSFLAANPVGAVITLIGVALAAYLTWRGLRSADGGDGLNHPSEAITTGLNERQKDYVAYNKKAIEAEAESVRQLAQLKNQLITDEHKRAIAEINEKYDHEYREIQKLALDKVEKDKLIDLNDAKRNVALKIEDDKAAKAKKELDKSIADQQRDLWYEGQRLRLNSITDQYQREKELINLNYDLVKAKLEETNEKGRNNAAISQSEQNRQSDLAKAVQDEMQRGQERKRAADAKAAQTQDLTLEANLKGEALERAKLALAEHRELTLAKGDAAEQARIKKQYELRNKILDLQHSQVDVRGTFNTSNLLGLQAASANTNTTLDVARKQLEALLGIKSALNNLVPVAG